MHKIKPRVSVDDVLFGANFQFLMSAGYVECPDSYDEETKWRIFRKNDEVDIYIKDDTIICIACFQDCVIDGICLIGMSPADLIAALGNPDEIGEAVWVSDNEQQIPYEYFSLGLQIWFEADKVVSVFCNATY
ncbi:hypothetical protein [Chitinimonas lacunae]|uniref:Uncharacterized protein n=1 Tax=Chitinimonas lacunae TaxID=1963018 RepID=A0ABV8MNY6_9NEIS